MIEILQNQLPDELHEPRALPGVQPLGAQDWLRVDDAYAAQMAYRRTLITTRRADVLWQDPAAEHAVADLHDEVLKLLPGLGYNVTAEQIICPDDVTIERAGDTTLAMLGRILQADICILDKRDIEHVLIAACLCFPANWLLSEKAGRPLVDIHKTVDDYDDRIARRVQRLFDGVQVGRPLWRCNNFGYDDPELFQPRSIATPRPTSVAQGGAPYRRAERQCILRLPKTDAVLFSIHTYVFASS